MCPAPVRKQVSVKQPWSGVWGVGFLYSGPKQAFNTVHFLRHQFREGPSYASFSGARQARAAHWSTQTCTRTHLPNWPALSILQRDGSRATGDQGWGGNPRLQAKKRDIVFPTSTWPEQAGSRVTTKILALKTLHLISWALKTLGAPARLRGLLLKDPKNVN